jgi:hypothetical protein
MKVSSMFPSEAQSMPSMVGMFVLQPETTHTCILYSSARSHPSVIGLYIYPVILNIDRDMVHMYVYIGLLNNYVELGKIEPTVYHTDASTKNYII